MKIEEFLSYLKNVKRVRENEYMALCPAHNDKKGAAPADYDHERLSAACNAFDTKMRAP